MTVAGFDSDSIIALCQIRIAGKDLVVCAFCDNATSGISAWMPNPPFSSRAELLRCGNSAHSICPALFAAEVTGASPRALESKRGTKLQSCAAAGDALNHPPARTPSWLPTLRAQRLGRFPRRCFELAHLFLGLRSVDMSLFQTFDLELRVRRQAGQFLTDLLRTSQRSKCTLLRVMTLREGKWLLRRDSCRPTLLHAFQFRSRIVIALSVEESISSPKALRSR